MTKEKLMNQNKQLYDALSSLLLLVQYETDLPQCAANGVVEWQTDEGVHRAGMILEEARVAIKDYELCAK